MGREREVELHPRAAGSPTRESTFPILILGISIGKPGVEPGSKAISALEHVFEHEFDTGVSVNGERLVEYLPRRDLVGDRAYGNHPKSKNFQKPARKLGFELVYEMRPEHIGQVLIQDGIAILEGNAYCPVIAMMPNLVSATADYYTGAIDTAVYHRRLELRSKLQLRVLQVAGTGSGKQLRCPATGPNPTASCVLRPQPAPDQTGQVKTLLPVDRAAEHG